MMNIHGYTLTTPVCETGDLILYQATRTQDGLPVLLKFPASPHPTPALLHRLEHEYQLARDLDPDRIARPLALERHGGTLALVLEQGPTETLAARLGSPMDIPPFLQIAIGINAALTELHRHELVHKELKPDHVLMDAVGHIWLTGLGIASSLPREHQAPEPPEVIAGTLAYMAPEQTGRMNRSINSRSDLYALGILFYQMLTGVLPFTAGDPMEWVHCHLARQPVPPAQRVPNLPKPLSEMVMKLLAKTAEERYQSTGGLDADLRNCLVQWEANSRIESFPLGERDAPGRLLIPEKLYGRQSQIDTLIAAFDRVASSGTPEIVLVSGYSGVGKTSVINELHKALVPSRGLFATGKYDQYTRDIPYATLIQATQALIRQVLGKSEAEVAVWREALQQAVNPNGQLIVSLIPEVEFIIGKQPPVADLPPQEAQNRFQMVLRRFLRGFAGPDHPLVIFLDDLQWLDTATLELLHQIAMGLEGKYILLIGAYRDNEVTPTHPLMKILDAMRKSGTGMQEIVLAPLAIVNVEDIIADSLRCERERALPLAQLVHEKTSGNPFFIIQFLTALADEKLLVFDRDAGCWNWDLARILAKNYTDNVVDLMVGKLNRLQAETQESLKQLACLGSKASLATLAQVQKITTDEVEKHLLEAIYAGFLLRQADSVAFLHDRLQEVAYKMIPEEERPKVHLNIGRTLLSLAGPEELGEILFDTTNHLNRGAGLMTDPAEKVQLAGLNAMAGRKARASVAYATARDFFAAAAALLTEEAWDSQYDSTFALYLNYAECEYLRGAFNEAEPLFDLLLAQAKSDFDQARVYRLQLTLYPVGSRYDHALAAGLKALQLLGVEIPEDAPGIDRAIQAEASAAVENWRGFRIADFANAPAASDPRIKAVISLLTHSAAAAYIGSSPQLFPLFTLKNVNYSLRYGPAKESCNAYTAYAFMLVSVFGDPQTGYAFSDMAIKLSQRFNDLSTIGEVLYLHGNHVNFWLNPIAADFPVLERGFHACLDAGNLVFANYIAYSIIWQAVEQGDALGDVLDFSRKYADFALSSRNEAIYQTIVLEQQFMQCLMGETQGSASFDSDGVNELLSVEKIAKASFTCGTMYYHTMKTMVAYLMGDDAASRTHAEKAGKILTAVMAQPMEAMFFFLHALVLTRACREAAEENRGEILKTLAAYQKKLAFWSENCPANFAGKHALVSAEIAELEGDELPAERLFEQAIESTRTNGFIHWQAMANEAAARFHGNRGLKTVSRAYLREAHACYARWGARGKVRQMEQHFPQLRETPPIAPISTFSVGTRDLDIHAVVQASQAISGEILLDNLLKTLMRIVLENAGARQGYLLLNGKEGLTLAITARVEKQHVVMQVQGESGFPEDMLPTSILNYVRHSRDKVILNDASSPHPYSEDAHFSRQHPKSVLCFPIVKQAELIGLLYLENDLTPHIFTPDRLAVLELLAAQAAISLENASVYKRLRDTELKFRRIVDNANEGIWILGPDTLTTSVNDRMAEMLGYTDAEIIGRPVTDFMFEEEVQEHLKQMEDRRQGLSKTYERRYRRKNGQILWTMVVGLPIFDDQHQFQGAFGMLTDITERKRAEEEIRILNQVLEQRVLQRTAELEKKSVELQDSKSALLNIVQDLNEKTAELARANIKLKEVDQLKSMFIASMSHELRTPLNSIIGFSSIMLNEWTGPLNAEQKENTAAVVRSGKHLLSLINDVIDVSKIETGKIESFGEDFDVHEVVLEAVETFRKDIEKKGLELTVQACSHVLHMDRRRLLQCLLNLLSNATKFTLKGSIGVYAELSADGSMVSIAVEDTGTGIREEDIGKLFSPFVRIHTPGESFIPGTGLGLYLSHKLLREILKGDILVTSTYGVGSRFTIRVPIPDFS